MPALEPAFDAAAMVDQPIGQQVAHAATRTRTRAGSAADVTWRSLGQANVEKGPSRMHQLEHDRCHDQQKIS